MDTPTLIEWIERQLETEEETAYRHLTMSRLHEKWHEEHPGIWGCCITVSTFSNMHVAPILTINERRANEQIMQDAIDAFKSYGTSVKDFKPIVLSEGMEIKHVHLGDD